MFIVISLALSFIVLTTAVCFSRKQHSELTRHFDTLILLRQLLQLSRQHRAATHYTLTCQLSSHSIARVNSIFDEILDCSHRLITQAPRNSRPMYRIFQNKLKAMHHEWQTRSVNRNQSIHGKSIRHCLFLLDEVMITWLIQSERDDMSSEYHMNWQQVLESMEVLTQLRLAIPTMATLEDQARVRYYCGKMLRKLNQLSFICPLSTQSPICTRASQALNEISESLEIEYSQEAMYDLTSDLSTVIAQVYDQVLSEMVETLYQPLPPLNLGATDSKLSRLKYA
ncbi:hypothetical protein EK599_21500 [Vibrio sp. T187]|uniref:hypothetical protein n=1 Tax=Vibrio TaxID=662 RepID=UPI0010C96CDD|nr:MULTISPECIES: hypothetical protein [Vibrio]MBW3698254.1 hypothetical protein [Vibrio sp. T187]